MKNLPARLVLWALCTLATLSLGLTSFAFAGETEPQAQHTGDQLPMAGQRSIRFTTDEGTWMSLDVSPDGRSVIFDLVGHLYTMPASGGHANAITSGMSFNSQPRFSPDGKKIVFVSDRSGAENVWIGNADGSGLRRISNDENALYVSPRWSRDGRYILVSRKKPYMYDSSFEAWIFDVEGGSGIAITQGKTSPDAPADSWHNALGLVQSLDQRTLYYAQRYGLFQDEISLPGWQLASRDMRTGEEEIITNAPGGAFRPELSPDGKLLAYATRYDGKTALRIHNLETLAERWVKFPIEHDDMESYVATRDLVAEYAFFPDGKELLIAYHGKFHRVNVATGNDVLVPFEAEVARELGPRLLFPARVEQGDVHARTLQGASQSPDGKRLAFSALTHVYVMDIPGGAPRRITTGSEREYQPAWSPDGQWLAYVTWENQSGFIWKTRADGSGQPQAVTSIPGFYRDPAWSPDGTRILALRDSFLPRAEIPNGMGVPNGLDIVWVPAEGGSPNLIAHGHGDSRPHFGADPERVYVSSAEQWPSMAPIRLTSMRWDGGDKKVVAKITSRHDWGREMTPYMQVQISPDELHAAILFRWNLYVFDLPKTGGEVPALDLSSPSVAVRRITDVGADSFAWADGGKTITWYLGAKYFRLPLADLASNTPGKDAAPPVLEDSRHKQFPPTHPDEFAIKLSRPRHVPQGVFVLQGARVITMRGDEVLPQASIVVERNRIREVGPEDKVAIPANAKVFDVHGATIMPGLIDMHTHYVEIHREILDLQNWDFFANLAYGVTTGRDVQAFTPDLFTYQDMVDLGEIPGPRAYSTGVGAFYVNDIQSEEEAAAMVSRYHEGYETNTIKSYLIGNRRQRQYVVEACQKAKVMATTEGSSDLKLDLTHVIDGFSGSEHVLPNLLYNDTVQLIARSGVFYDPTFLVGYGGPSAFSYFSIGTNSRDDPKLQRFLPHNALDSRMNRVVWFHGDEYTFQAQAASAKAVVRAGGKVCVGSEGMLQGAGVHWDLWALQSGGMTNLEALRAGTLCGAEGLGLDRDLGSIESGKLADFIVLSRNPLDDIRNTMAIRFVVKDGEIFDGDTLEELWPQQKPAPRNWWQDDKPKETRPE